MPRRTIVQLLKQERYCTNPGMNEYHTHLRKFTVAEMCDRIMYALILILWLLLAEKSTTPGTRTLTGHFFKGEFLGDTTLWKLCL